MYVTTAAITGLIIVAMLMISTGGYWVWRLLVLPLALVAITGTLPIRKSLAIALEYVFDHWFDRQETQTSERIRHEKHTASDVNPGKLEQAKSATLDDTRPM